MDILIPLAICILLALCPVTHYIFHFLIYFALDTLVEKVKPKEAAINAHELAIIFTKFTFNAKWKFVTNYFKNKKQ